MGVLTTRQALEVARSAGFGPEQSIVAVAIATAESGLRTDARGDLALVGRPTPSGETWGPSIGLWQIRSIQERAGTGDPRDATRLTDPAFNARSAHAISAGGSNWGPYRGRCTAPAPTAGTSPTCATSPGASTRGGT